ncbi:ComEC/Rec2 family competence protein [Rhodocista pekingensis]|uniref:ComEC/Rec2 family competence protein n=1 Tax=Rhodocista pekingensis TaxID=201185 RepID=A0ABW2KQ32_9PROT
MTGWTDAPDADALDADTLDGDGYDPPAAPPGRVRTLIAAVRAPFLEERDRWVLWLPVGLSAGILVYFALPTEPPGWLGAALLPALGLFVVLSRRRWPGSGAALLPTVLLILVAGFAAAQVRTWSVAAPVLAHETRAARVEGRVVGIDRLEEGLRVTLADVTVGRLPVAETPARVRLRLKKGDVAPAAGARIGLLAVLRPPPDAPEPGAYDFRRHAYFLRLGAVGFALSAAEPLPAPPPDGWAAVQAGLERLRQGIAERVEARLDGAAGAVATALLNGEPTAIPESDLEAMRVSGLQHLLSISGLHIGLVAGLVFFTLRALLALVEPLALRRPIKKWAAVAALAAALGYTVLVGAPVPTVRSALMTGLMLLAVLVDRSPFSLRVVAFAATVVLLWQPEALLGPSFQMSFGAVIALVSAYEAAGPTLRDWHAQAGPVRRTLLYVGGLALTSLVAGTATTPFGLYHFQQGANYGLLANLLAVPVTSFWVMPWGLLVYCLMPFGLDGWAVEAMGMGVQAILWTAHAVAGLPGAVLHVPAAPAAALLLFVIGGVWLALWRRSWRFLGLVPMGLAVALAAMAARPDLRVTSSGKLVGIRAADGSLLVSTGRAARFEAEVWWRRDGGTDAPPRWPKAGSADGRLACDPLVCRYRLNGVTAAIVMKPEGLADACTGADLVITRLRALGCDGPRVIDSAALRERGAHAVFIGPDGRIEIRTGRPRPLARPWS